MLAKLLELSVIEGKAALDVSDVMDLRLLLDSVVSETQAIADLAGVTVDLLEAEHPAIAQGDPFILRAAIMSLLENAVDFSPAGGTVKVGLETAGAFHRIVIADEGEGIPEYAREKVFERFFSLRHMGSGRKGTGLGLTLVREAADLHQGSVVLEPNDSRGTRAVLAIPGC